MGRKIALVGAAFLGVMAPTVAQAAGYRLPFESGTTVTITQACIDSMEPECVHSAGYPYSLSQRYAIDFGCIEGRSIHAIQEGTVDLVGFENGGYGNYIKLRHPDGRYSLYAHLQERPFLAKGTSVAQGQQIGKCGQTGASYQGPHLHLELRKSASLESNVVGTDPILFDECVGNANCVDGQVVYSRQYISINDGSSPTPTSGGTIFRRNGEIWESLPGSGRDIDVGANGAAWLIGTNPVPGGYGVYQWDALSSTWTSVDKGAVRIAVAPDGSPWVVNSNGEIFKRSDDTWQKLPGSAKDIDIGENGDVWIIGTNPVNGGYGIYQWNKDDSVWSVVSGGGVGIAVNSNGSPWVVNSDGGIYEWINNSWHLKPSRARDIAIGGVDDSVWIIGTNPVNGGYEIYQWNNSGWQQFDGGAVKITVDPQGLPWVTNSISD